MSSNAKSSGMVDFSIKVNSNLVDKKCPIFSIVVDKTINKIPFAKILVYDGDPTQQVFLISNSKIFDIGNPIEIELGYQANLTSVFKGIITRQSIKADGNNPPYLEVYCKDLAYRTTLIPKTISFSNVTDTDALSTILQDYSYLETDIGSTSVKYEALSQQDTTDWDFINIRAEANGQVVIVSDGKLTTQEPDTNQSPSLTFTYGIDIHSIDLEMDGSTQWQDAGGIIWESSSQQIQNVNAVSVTEKSFGAVSGDQLADFNKQKSVIFLHGGAVTQEEMTNFSTSLLSLNRVSKIRGKIRVQGVADVQLGSTIKIDKGADNFQGTAYVSGIHHSLEIGEWVTELTVGLPTQRYMRRYADIPGLPAAGMVSPIYGLQIGVVQKLTDDPLSSYRIFVNIPIIHPAGEGIWCRVASFYASNGIGAFIMPEIDDEVIVGFINDDFRSPVIVGSLYSTKNPTPIPEDENNTIKTLVTKSRLEMSFNEEDKSIVFKTPGGRTITISDKTSSIEIVNGDANTITLGSQDVEITSNQNITLNAKKNINLQATENIVLQATNEVDITGMNISAKANMKASLVGTTSAEVQSTAATIIKGTIVQIN